ncbi:TadA family conjugal transfer-associated ATPase [Actinotignum urinale]|uniref:TadA family conjugal transfer-associated ATPase n=1 Tax=Actinotignum urinale TaxID=190146 RepID=UPI001FE42644|nr:TadA family conjugal transfer-associated ATPase [Actinotignum urinale]WIK59748.1 TadA family conjugal transfer-associated ATPase [Actinotignum urinale]
MRTTRNSTMSKETDKLGAAKVFANPGRHMPSTTSSPVAHYMPDVSTVAHYMPDVSTVQHRDEGSQSKVADIRRHLAQGKNYAEVISQIQPFAVGAKKLLGYANDIENIAGGLGAQLHKLVNSPDVTDILINGTRGVWVDRGNGVIVDEELSAHVGREEDVRALAVRLAAQAGARLDDASPIADATFGDGIRLHAVLAPLAEEGTCISLRIHRPVGYTLDELAERGSFNADIAHVLRGFIHQKANVLISGATGSGKTTLLSALLSEVPAHERILVIEEATELRPRHPHILHLRPRQANVQGSGEINLSDIVRAAMRMRPDRIILGECRGTEIRDVLSALNTGHQGSWGTVHANSAHDVPNRLVALGALAGMSENMVRAQACSAFDAVIHVARHGQKRYIAQISLVESDGEKLRCVPALEVNASGESAIYPGWETIHSRWAGGVQ